MMISSMRRFRRGLVCLALLALVGTAAAGAGEDPAPVQPINLWYGNGSPFVFSEGDHGEKLVKIGNQDFWLMTPDKLATDSNPGLAHRNVALVGDVGLFHEEKRERYWYIEFAGNDAIKYTHGPNSYEENLEMARGLRSGHAVMLTGQAKISPDGKGSILVVAKPFRVPLEIDRLKSYFEYRQKHKPDYEAYKQLADELDQKATKAMRARNEHLAGQFRGLREQVIEELLSLQAAILNNDLLSFDEMEEYMQTILKYQPEDRPRAAEVLKRMMKKAPTNPKLVEAARGLLPDWVLCAEAKEWMTRVECEKLRQTALAQIEAARQKAIEENNAHQAELAMNSNLRHTTVIKNQALLNNSGLKLPAEKTADWKALSNLLQTSDDYRLIQQLLLQSIAQLDRKEWVRLVVVLLDNKNQYIRLLAYKVGAYSQDPPTLHRLALALRTDNSNLIKADAVKAICETRSATTVQTLVECLVSSTDDNLNQELLVQLQRLTNRKDTAKDAWQRYVKTPEQIVVVPE